MGSPAHTLKSTEIAAPRKTLQKWMARALPQTFACSAQDVGLARCTSVEGYAPVGVRFAILTTSWYEARRTTACYEARRTRARQRPATRQECERIASLRRDRCQKRAPDTTTCAEKARQRQQKRDKCRKHRDSPLALRSTELRFERGRAMARHGRARHQRALVTARVAHVYARVALFCAVSCFLYAFVARAVCSAFLGLRTCRDRGCFRRAFFCDVVLFLLLSRLVSLAVGAPPLRARFLACCCQCRGRVCFCRAFFQRCRAFFAFVASVVGKSP